MLPALFLALLLSILQRAQVPVIAVAGVAVVVVTLAWSGTAGGDDCRGGGGCDGIGAACGVRF